MSYDAAPSCAPFAHDVIARTSVSRVEKALRYMRGVFFGALIVFLGLAFLKGLELCGIEAVLRK